MLKVGITGGIGSGKSTLSHALESLGVPIYYTDMEAKRLMQESEALRGSIVATFGDEAYLDGELNREYLAARIFSDPAQRALLDGIVHPAVRADFHRWAAEQQAEYVALESAILFDAGLDKELDCSVAVLAPEPLRIERIKQRDGMSEEQIRARIAAQMSDEMTSSRANYTVVNIIEAEIVDSAERLDKILRREASKR